MSSAVEQSNSRPASLHPAAGQSLVWRLIEMQRTWPAQIAAVALFVGLFHFLFSWSWSLTIALLLSMFLHECGHALVFRLANIRFILLFLFPLGAVAAPVNQAENARSDQLHWYTISWLLQAGPAVNVLLMLFGVAVQSLPAAPELRLFARDLVYVNGLLASMNLIPLWTLDSGQLFNVIYNSLEEHEDKFVTGSLLLGVLLVLLFILRLPGMLSWAMILSNTIIHFGWVAFLLVFAVGILNKQAHDKPENAQSKQAMSNRQVLIHLVVYFALVTLTLWFSTGAPV